jgi:hypothetical protein
MKWPFKYSNFVTNDAKSVYKADSILAVICGLVVGIFWISFIIWNRLIRERLPRDLTLGEPYSITFLIVLILFLFYLCKVFFIIYNEQKKLRGIILTRNKYLQQFYNFLLQYPKFLSKIDFILNHIVDSPLYLWRFFYFNLRNEYINPVVDKLYFSGCVIFRKVYSSETRELHISLTVILLVFAPRIITFSVFFYEILINKELYYFYWVAVILLITYIYYAYRKMLFDISYYENLKLQEKFIRVIDNGEKSGILWLEPRDGIYNESFYIKEHIYRLSDEFQILILKMNTYEKDKVYFLNYIVYMLLMLSFLFWLLIIFKLY